MATGAPAPVIAVGLDGCPQGWAVVALDAGGGVELRAAERVTDVTARYPDALLAIDIPVGLTDEPVREADAAARRALGGAASSVFNAPPRTVVDEVRDGTLSSHAAASARGRALTGKGLSAQTWRITPKVAEVDAFAEAATQPVLEVHPEVSFRALAGDDRLARKRTYRGVLDRLALLDGVGLRVPTSAPAAWTLQADDVLDAAVAAWTAFGKAVGEPLRSFPPEPRHLDRGVPVAIWARLPRPPVA